jgi:serine/threonine protein phosphatase PrpC
MLGLEVALLSEPGGRKYNEDACGHWHSDRHLCCVLADGAGGHGGGDVASRLAVQELIGRFARRPTVDGQALRGLVRETNDALIGQRVPGTAREDMHSTVVCLVVDFVGHQAHWAHAGDSRLYWFRGARMLARTRDHSLVQSMVDAGMLAESDVRLHPKRSELRSALGIAADVLEVSSGDADRSVEAGDVFLLCTDGLWEYVDDAVLEATLAEADTPRRWLDALAATVLRNAAHKTSHDNFSALVVWTRAV